MNDQKMVVNKAIELSRMIKEFMKGFNAFRSTYERVNRRIDRIHNVEQPLKYLNLLNAKIFAEETKLVMTDNFMLIGMLMNVNVPVGFLQYKKFALVFAEYYESLEYLHDELPDMIWGKMDYDSIMPFS